MKNQRLAFFMCVLTLAPMSASAQSPAALEKLAQASVDQALDLYKITKDADALAGALQAYIDLETRLIQVPSISPAALAASRRLEGSGRSVASGAPAAVGAGTSLVSSGLITSLVSGAIESGALQKTTSGTVNTFRVNALAGWALANRQLPQVCDRLLTACPIDLSNPLAGLSLALSFDSSRKDQAVPSGTDAVFLRTQRTLSAFQIRYDLYRRRLPSSKEFQDHWEAAVKKLGKDSSVAATLQQLADRAAVQVKLGGLTPLKRGEIAKRLHTDSAFGAATKDGQRELLRAEARRAVNREMILNPYTAELKQALSVYEAQRNKLLTEAIWRKSLSAEFTHQRPVDEPTYGNGRLVIATPIGRKEKEEGDDAATVPVSELTLNLGANFFYTPPKLQPTRHLRDFQASLQLTRRLTRWSVVNAPLLAVSGYYQYLTDNAVLEFNGEQISSQTGLVIPSTGSAILKDTKGGIYIGQVKLTFPIGKSGISFPIAISTSNRTELLKTKGTDVRGNFGILFDLDTLINNLKQ